jgi:hypothetical protein
VAIGIYLLVRRRPSSMQRRGIVAGLLAGILPALAWIGWGVRTYGWRGVFLSSPTTRAHQPVGAAWVGQKIQGLVYSFVPMPLAHDLRGHPFAGNLGGWITANDALQFPFNTYTGALGLVACLLLLFWYGQARLSGDAWFLGLSVVTCAALGSVVLDSAFLVEGAAVNAMGGAVALGIVFLATLIPVQRHYRAVLTLVGLEMAAVFAVYLGFLSVGPWRLNPNVPILAQMGQRMLSESLGTPGVLVMGLTMVLFLGGVCFLARASLATRQTHRARRPRRLG